MCLFETATDEITSEWRKGGREGGGKERGRGGMRVVRPHWSVCRKPCLCVEIFALCTRFQIMSIHSSPTIYDPICNPPHLSSANPQFFFLSEFFPLLPFLPTCQSTPSLKLRMVCTENQYGLLFSFVVRSFVEIPWN